MSAPFPTGTTTAAGGSPAPVEDLVPDRRVAVVLRLLGAVLEERKPSRSARALGHLLRLVEVGALEAKIGAELSIRSELRARRAFRGEHDRAHPGALCGPGRRGAVVPRGGRDDRRPRPLAIALDGRQRAAPLERAELVPILALEEDLATTA